jgi:hypothetical protein
MTLCLSLSNKFETSEKFSETCALHGLDDCLFLVSELNVVIAAF